METKEPLSFTVTTAEAGQRLDMALVTRWPEFSRSQLARLAKVGQVKVDGRPGRPSARLISGQFIICPSPATPLTDLTPDPELKLDILYEDKSILAVNKPWGLLVHPAPGTRGPTLAGGLLAHDSRFLTVGERFRPGLVHRLDRDTSGVMVIARTELALKILTAAFSRRETTKRYLAFVRGRPHINRGDINLSIGRHPSQRHKMTGGGVREKPARTLFQLLRYFPTTNISLLLLTLLSGRTHQARVHLASLGCPVLADPVYSRGVGDLFHRYPSLIPYLHRQLLHARRLTINHPTTTLPLTLRAPWPEDFTSLWQELMYLEKL
ncbi:MAG: RluA family pseudouridine synthase [Candidatus Adiutrix intracellularis]|nr:RluA family pseudouridine synthase [Candidatus Adiutrix intracellularis]